MRVHGTRRTRHACMLVKCAALTCTSAHAMSIWFTCVAATVTVRALADTAPSNCEASLRAFLEQRKARLAREPTVRRDANSGRTFAFFTLQHAVCCASDRPTCAVHLLRAHASLQSLMPRCVVPRARAVIRRGPGADHGIVGRRLVGRVPSALCGSPYVQRQGGDRRGRCAHAVRESRAALFADVCLCAAPPCLPLYACVPPRSVVLHAWHMGVRFRPSSDICSCTRARERKSAKADAHVPCVPKSLRAACTAAPTTASPHPF